MWWLIHMNRACQETIPPALQSQKKKCTRDYLNRKQSILKGQTRLPPARNSSPNSSNLKKAPKWADRFPLPWHRLIKKRMNYRKSKKWASWRKESSSKKPFWYNCHGLLWAFWQYISLMFMRLCPVRKGLHVFAISMIRCMSKTMTIYWCIGAPMILLIR